MIADPRRPQGAAVPGQVEVFTIGWAGERSYVRRRGCGHEQANRHLDTPMCHGRKSRPLLFHGHKRHMLRDLDTGPIVAMRII